MKHSTKKRPEASVLASLRAIAPRRALTPRESLQVAELQANRLLESFQITTSAVPDEVVSDLPRITIVRVRELPISGSAHWSGRQWVITLNADEPYVRQRFSLVHEFKHVLDYTASHYLYRDTGFQTAAEQAERAADYFAACVLMPKSVVKRLWLKGPQDVARIAATLQVSAPAARYRLQHLGLLHRTMRCRVDAVVLRVPASALRLPRHRPANPKLRRGSR